MDTITLKWGTLKGWNLESEEAKKIMKEYVEHGAKLSTMAQRDTTHQKQLICNLIDIVDEIYNDWEGGTMTKDEAKKYIMEYDSA